MERRNFMLASIAGVTGIVNVEVLGTAEDEPTFITRDGTKQWFNQFGEFHRVNGPAIIENFHVPAALTLWYKNGKIHRVGGPAKVCQDGTEWWYQNGQLHRENGPAITFSNTKDGKHYAWFCHGEQHWYLNGKRHRADGPATVHADGSAEVWYYNGELHREGGPAQRNKKFESWYRHGKSHRTNGPSHTHIDGTKHWHQNGLLHREDGPALITMRGNGDTSTGNMQHEWFLNGIQQTLSDMRVRSKQRS